MSPRTPSKSMPRRSLPVPAYRPPPSPARTHSTGVCRVSSGAQMAPAWPSSALARAGPAVGGGLHSQPAFSALGAPPRPQQEASSKTKKGDSGRWRPREGGNSRWGRCGVERGREGARERKQANSKALPQAARLAGQGYGSALPGLEHQSRPASPLLLSFWQRPSDQDVRGRRRPGKEGARILQGQSALAGRHLSPRGS